MKIELIVNTYILSNISFSMLSYHDKKRLLIAPKKPKKTTNNELDFVARICEFEFVKNNTSKTAINYIKEYGSNTTLSTYMLEKSDYSKDYKKRQLKEYLRSKHVAKNTITKAIKEDVEQENNDGKMRNYSSMYNNAVESNATPTVKRETEKRELDTRVPVEKNAKLTKKIGKKKQELTDIRKELLFLKSELKKRHELIGKGSNFSVWKKHTENTHALSIMGKIEKLQGENESLSQEIAHLKKSYTLESLLYIPTVKNFWKGTVYESYESYLVYLLIFRKSYNFKQFIKVYETPVDELISVASLQLLSAEKAEIAENILKSNLSEIEKKYDMKKLIANTTRRAMINFARVTTLDITISERAINSEKEREKVENKAHRHMLKAKKLATAGKVQRFISATMNRNAQMKKKTTRKKAILKGFSGAIESGKPHDVRRTVATPFHNERERVVQTENGWIIEHATPQKSYSYYEKNIKPLLENKACLLSGTHESMRFDGMKETTREIAPLTYLQFFEGFSVAEIARMEKVSATTIYNTLRAEKDALRAELKRRA